MSMVKSSISLIVLLLILSGCYGSPSAGRPVSINATTVEAVSIDEYLRRGAAYEIEGRHNAAIRQYRAVIDMDALDSRGYFGAGNIYMKTHRYNLAEGAFEMAIELNPDEGLYYNNLAWVYIETLRPVQAIVTVSMALSLDIERRHVYLNTLAVASMAIGNYAASEQYLKEAAMIVFPMDIAGQIRIYESLLVLYMRSSDEAMANMVRGKLFDLRRGIPVMMDF
ncbi:MAG: tetratricopeptide repeat protein [Deltaproteobacteria bacterium]|nr:tetratricopeptide repeat protein [Deltaproteobacteria bacterium]